ncbi:MAG TPA: ABC transporter ATP-binding protein [Opitutales bacterium]|nr:ABC transporter ATP-binding protein [Opitutales bacterium]
MLLSVENLSVSFATRHGRVPVIRGVSFHIDAGETLGVVGESGSGKSVTGSAILRILPATASIDSGRILFDGADLATARERELRGFRGRRIGMIFQDPLASLNPYLTIGAQVAEGLRLHMGLSSDEARKAAIAELEAVGLPDAASRMNSHPHQFSGGQRQRIMIATALALRPGLLIADEPTTALDVTVQAQILELFKARQKALGTAVMMITHNLGVAAALCDRIQVMYAGMLMESGTAEDILLRPAHPYTAALRKSIPSGTSGRLFSIPGTPPAPGEAPEGCPFAPRCTFAKPECALCASPAEVSPGHVTLCGRVLRGDIERNALA